MQFSEYDNVVEPFLASVEARPEEVAVVFQGEKITYRQMNERVNRFAHLLASEAGVKAGDKVAYLLPNCPEIPEIYYAVQKLGAVAVPLNFKLIGREVGYLVNASGASALLFDARFAEAVAEAAGEFDHPVQLFSVGGAAPLGREAEPLLAEAAAGEPELFHDPSALSRIQFTGGSTGLPKGAARTHRADLVELASVTASNTMAEKPGAVVLVQCPLEHHGGHSWFTSAFATQATLIICEAFNAERILHDIETYRVTHMILLPPTTYQRLLRCPTIGQFDLSSVRIVQSAAGATTLAMIRAVYERFPNAELNYGWGQSESGTGTSLRITRAMLDTNSPRLASVGLPMPYATLKIVDEAGNPLPPGEVGEALIKTDAAMAGYYGQPDLTAAAFTEDGWLRTGDMMECDEQGYFYIRSRKKDMIKSGGENVFVAEVESVLREHPDIDDCLVFGTSDPVMGEAVAAVVQPRPGAQLSASIVQEHCKRTIASYKKPRYVVFMDDMGRDAAGKVRKSAIVDYFDAHKEQAAPRFHEKVWDSPELYLIQVPFSGGTPIGYTNVYYLRTPERGLLIDTGTSHEASFQVLHLALEDLGVDMATTDIFLTHFHIDHLGLAASVAVPGTRIFLSATDEALFRARGEGVYRGTLKRRLEAEGFEHADIDQLMRTDAALIPRVQWPMPDTFQNLADGEVLQVGPWELEVIDTPGHTPGHQCLYVRGANIMFYGDHVLRNSSPNIAPFSMEEDSLGDYLASLRKVAAYDVRGAAMGHGFVDMKGQAEATPARIAWLEEHHRHRLDEICAAVADRPGMTGTEVAKAIHWNIPYDAWDDIPIIQRWIIVSETAAHLDHLVETGSVRRETRGERFAYFPACGD